MVKLAELTKVFSGTDIESIVRDVAYKVVADCVQLLQELFIEVLYNIISLSNTNSEKIGKVRTLSKEQAMQVTKN